MRYHPDIYIYIYIYLWYLHYTPGLILDSFSYFSSGKKPDESVLLLYLLSPQYAFMD